MDEIKKKKEKKKINFCVYLPFPKRGRDFKILFKVGKNPPNEKRRKSIEKNGRIKNFFLRVNIERKKKKRSEVDIKKVIKSGDLAPNFFL